MTVAHLREREGDDRVEVLFLESARIYRLSKEHPDFVSLLALLRNALDSRHVVKVQVAPDNEDRIEDVERA